MKKHLLVIAIVLVCVNNALGQMVITPAAVNTNSLSTDGSIGIGTGTSWQAAKLHILGTTNQFRLANGTFFNDINTNSAGHLVFQPGTTAGRIGFGIASPTSAFHSNMGIFTVTDPASTTRGVQISPNITASIGDAPMGALVVSTIQTSGEGISYAPGFFPGIKMGAYAFNNPITSGGVMKSMWETTNTIGGVDPNLLLVKNGGKVGIGTGAVVPDKLLTVKSTVMNTQIAKFADDMRYIGLGRDEIAAFDLAGNIANLYLGGSGKVTILATGETGVGTTLPKSKLDVIGSIRAGIEGSGEAIDPNTAINIYASNTPTGLKVKTWNNALKAMTVENTNFINSPFTVYGDGNTVINAGYSSLKYFRMNDASAAGTPKESLTISGNGRTDINGVIRTDKYFVINDVSVSGSPIESFAISGSGYTKINVMNPLAMDNVIDVVDVSVTPNVQMFRVKTNGHVFAREVEIRNISQPFPDYVFSKDYNLMPLSEVEKYIGSNKHLPGFEKGTYYEENGIKSSEMFIKQQEKIEELTLYIIELEKRMKAIEESSKH